MTLPSQASRSERRRAAGMFGGICRHGNPVDDDRLSSLDLTDFGRELAFDSGGAGEKQLHELRKTIFEARWADQRERCSAPAVELCIQNEERQTAEVIPVQVRNENRGDAVWIDPEFADRDQARSAAIDQEATRLAIHIEAGVEPAAAAKGVSAAEEL
jgi:hypothetical protein